MSYAYEDPNTIELAKRLLESVYKDHEVRYASFDQIEDTTTDPDEPWRHLHLNDASVAIRRGSERKGYFSFSDVKKGNPSYPENDRIVLEIVIPYENVKDIISYY